MEGDEGQQNPYSLPHILMQGIPDGTYHPTYTTGMGLKYWHLLLQQRTL